MTPSQFNLDVCPSGSVPYVIKRGDTLNKIARLYGTTVERIIQYNTGIIPTHLRIGDTICVPAQIQYYPSCPTTNYYVVQPGDTLTSIANYFNISPEQLMLSNYGVSLDLYVHQVLCIPVSPSPVSVEANVSNKTFYLYKGNTLFKQYKILPVNPDRAIPRGSFKVISKQLDPSISESARWIGLSQVGFGIRGITTLQFIRRVATNQDIVLNNNDINEVFNFLPVGTNVNII